MSTGPDKDSDKISVARLRLLAGIEPPKALRDKLVAALPPMAASQVGSSLAWRWPKAVSWASVAVAAAIVFVAVLWLLPPTGRPLPSIVDINDRSATATMADANFLHPKDGNICDNNAL